MSGSIYSTNGYEATKYILKQSACFITVVDTIENMNKVLAAKQSGECPNLKHIVVYMEDPPKQGEQKERNEEYKSCIWSWKSFIKLGSAVSDSKLLERINDQSPGMVSNSTIN